MNITNRFKDNVYPARSVVGRLGSGGIDMLRHWLLYLRCFLCVQMKISNIFILQCRKIQIFFAWYTLCLSFSMSLSRITPLFLGISVHRLSLCLSPCVSICISLFVCANNEYNILILHGRNIQCLCKYCMYCSSYVLCS